MKKAVSGIMLSVLIFWIFGSAFNLKPALSSQVYSQEKAPDFTLTDIYGETFCLYACSARVVLIEFFGTWCPPCVHQVPALRNTYSNYSRDQLEMISISQEDEDVLLDFAEENNVTWVVAYDPGGEVHTSYGVQYIPTIFIVDTQRYIRYEHVGLTEESTLRSEIERLLPKTIYVDDDNTAGPWDGTPEHPYQNITSGLEHASANDTIYVYNGTYYENIVLNKSVSLIGEDRNTTIVDGGGAGTVAYIKGTDNVNITGFTIRNSLPLGLDEGSGIYLKHSSNNVISGNIISSNGIGIYIRYGSDNNIIRENEIRDNGAGIWLYACSHNNFTENRMTNNSYNLGFELIGDLSDFIHNIDTSNTINGKPVYYLVNQSNLIIDLSTFPNIGYLGLVDSANITVRNLDLTNNNGEGVLLAFTTNSKMKNTNLSNNLIGVSMIASNGSTINNNNASYCGAGVLQERSNDNNISNNTMTHCRYNGILMYFSERNSIKNNRIWGNETGEIGVRLSHSNNNTVVGNYISNNWQGICLGDSSNNTLHHNIFIDNTYQAKTSGSCNNTWDDGYPSGGNYWSDYNGTDLCSGPYQNETGSDDIGDTPYEIDENNQDNYPLMEPWKRVSGNLEILEPANGSAITGPVAITFTIENTGDYVEFLQGDSSNRIDLEIEYRSTGGEIEGWGITFWSTSYYGLVLHSGDKYTETVLFDPSEYEDDAPPDFVGDAPYGETTIRLVHWKQMHEGWGYGEFGVTEISVTLLPLDTEPPIITVLSPQNTTYTTTSVPLTFTVNESTSWIGYSMDNQANVTITGNSTLTGLSTGVHSITVYANDTAGNIGASDTIYFTVTPKTLLGTGWGWMRINANETVHGRAELYKIRDERIELVITYEGDEYSRTWNIIFHKEYKYGEGYLCHSLEWGFLIVGLHKHRRWQFWYALGRGTIAFGFPRFGRLMITPI